MASSGQETHPLHCHGVISQALAAGCTLVSNVKASDSPPRASTGKRSDEITMR